jgi:hypothetical protein
MRAQGDVKMKKCDFGGWERRRRRWMFFVRKWKDGKSLASRESQW